MIRLVFLLGTFYLGLVMACDEVAKANCTLVQKEAIKILSKLPSITPENEMEHKCGLADFLTTCVRNAMCSEYDANNARDEFIKEQKLDCDSLNENDEEKCRRLSEECEQPVVQVQSERSVVCGDVYKYKECLDGTAGQACNTQLVSRQIIAFMKEQRLECSGIWENMCMDLKEMENCVTVFSGIVSNLGLQEEAKCRLAGGLERCLANKGQCLLGMIQHTLRRVLDSTDCSEYLDVCNQRMEVACAMNYGNSNEDKCEKLKVFRDCLQHNSSCPMSRVHFTLRRAMEDEGFDCADVNACNLIEAESCQIDVYANMTDTKGNQCKRFKQFTTCMVTAKCNDKYLDSKVALAQKHLSNPCHAASILASIVLTLLMAIFTSLWK